MELYALKKFNNYFNRKIIRLDTLAQYLAYTHQTQSNISFKPADGLNTKQIVNFKPDADYAVLTVKETVEGTPIETIDSRWFIINANRLRNGQYELTLKRDLIADNYDRVINAPAFIQKAVVNSESDPAIFNVDSAGLNQIKKEEILLKDRTQCPWIVGYVASNAGGESITIDSAVEGETPVVISTTIENWKFYGFNENSPFISKPYDIKYATIIDKSYAGSGWRYEAVIDSNGNVSSSRYDRLQTGTLGWLLKSQYNNLTLTQYVNYVHTAYANATMLDINGITAEEMGSQSSTDESELLSYKGKLIKDSNNNFYRIQVVQMSDLVRDMSAVTASMSTLQNAMKTRALSMGIIDTSTTYSQYNTRMGCKCRRYIVYTLPVTATQTSYTYSNTRIKSSDANYDMFCMPYGEVKIVDGSYTEIVTTSSEFQSNAASRTSTALGSKCYDVQILPYCPLQGIISSDKTLKVDTLKENIEYTLIKTGDTPSVTKGIIFYVPKANFTFNIDKQMDIDRPSSRLDDEVEYYDRDEVDYEVVDNDASFSIELEPGETLDEVTYFNAQYFSGVTASDLVFRQHGTEVTLYFRTDAPAGEYQAMETTLTIMVHKQIYNNPRYLDLKMSNECDMYRLCSPNYAGQFEFSLAKNGGVNYFNVDVTLKPYNPYIHVNPNFSGLYGQDFNDSRGLICNGDFSFGTVSDAFTQYEIQNKNYENIFNRQIQNMDFNNQINKQESIVSALAGSLQGAAGGAMVGNLIGGLPGGALGSAVGGLASLAGGMADYANQQARFEESKSFAIDNYNYNLGNIKALPYSLTKCPALNANNKLYPFIEKYSCTETERTAVEDKLNYNGWTIMRIGTLSEFKHDDPTFMQAQIIRLDNLEEDYDYANAIYGEIARGVYL